MSDFIVDPLRPHPTVRAETDRCMESGEIPEQFALL